MCMCVSSLRPTQSAKQGTNLHRIPLHCAVFYGRKGFDGMGSKGGRGRSCGGTLLPPMENPAYTYVKIRQNTQPTDL